MSEKTSIEWTKVPMPDGSISTGSTWNPVAAFNLLTVAANKLLPPDKQKKERGWFCTKVSPECAQCYAEELNLLRGTGLEYLVSNVKNHAFDWAIHKLVKLEDTRAAIRRQPEGLPAEAFLYDPLRWTTPRAVFPCSMTDLFFEKYPDEWLDDIFAIMWLAGRIRGHVFQVTTKRIERAEKYLNDPQTPKNVLSRIVRTLNRLRQVPIPAAAREMLQRTVYSSFEWPLRNLWLGVSAGTQKYADKWIPVLQRCLAALRWVSGEPLLEEVDYSRYLVDRCAKCGAKWPCEEHDIWRKNELQPGESMIPADPVPGIDWLVIGGESGTKEDTPHSRAARPFDLGAAALCIQHTRASKTPLFIKQFGTNPMQPVEAAEGVWHEANRRFYKRVVLKDAKGGEWSEWPDDWWRIREYPALPEKTFHVGEEIS
jgi:protein gp37